jgi:uncharacterized heparinase superfamily protein
VGTRAGGDGSVGGDGVAGSWLVAGSSKLKTKRRKAKGINMHECPFCGYVCDCDMDDTWDLPIPDDCPHVCQEDDLESDWEDYEEFMDFEEE